MKTAQKVMPLNNDKLLKSLLFDNEAATRRVNNNRSEKEAKKQRIEVKLKNADNFFASIIK